MRTSIHQPYSPLTLLVCVCVCLSGVHLPSWFSSLSGLFCRPPGRLCCTWFNPRSLLFCNFNLSNIRIHSQLWKIFHVLYYLFIFINFELHIDSQLK